MKIFVVFTMLFTLGACRFLGEEQRSIFYEENYARWIFAQKVDILSPDIKPETRITVSGAALTWRALLSLTMINAGGETSTTDCLFYRIPHAQDERFSGELKVLPASSQGHCEGQEDIKTDNKITGIKNLSFELNREKALLKIIIEKKQEQVLEWIFPLLNMNSTQGITYLPQKNLGPSLRTGHELMGKWSDNPLEKTLVTCHQMDDQCKEVIPFHCNRCRYGWFEGVGKKQCPGGGPKFCGTNHCGQRGWPACPRGYTFSGLSTLPTCVEGSLAAFCEKGLNSYCQDGVVVCL